MSRPPAGLLETVRVVNGRAPLWPLHLERAERSAAALGLVIPGLQPPVGGPDRVVRYEMRDGEVQVTEREVGSTAPLALLTAGEAHRGYRHKTLDRAWLEAARLTAGELDADDALFFDGEGRLVEATIWAIGWWDRETLVFPPLELGGLDSVARRRVGECARGGIRTAPIDRKGLRGKALVACNAARGIVAVAALDEDAVLANHRTVAVARRFWERPLPTA